MSTNHTQHYDLCQWQETDKVLRTDFNEDNAKIDSALAEMDKTLTAKGNCRIEVGSYVGTGQSGSAYPCILEFPFQPKMVFLNTQEMLNSNSIPKYYILFPGMIGFPVPNSGTLNRVKWGDKTLSWYYGESSGTAAEKASHQYNVKGKTYQYMILG